MSGLLELVVLTATILSALTWAGVAARAPRRRVAPQVTAPARAARARLWLYAPLWVPAVLVAASMTPGLSGAVMGVGDHCMTHGGHHHHLCVLHPPHASNLPWIPYAVAAAWLPLLVAFALAARAGAARLGAARALVRSSRPSALGDDVRLLEQREPIALTVGLLEPAVLLSRGLLDAVSPQGLEVILAHERAHVRRRDTAWAFVDALAASILPRSARVALLDEITLAQEQACDAAAAAERGREPVVSALMEVARLRLAAPAFGMSAGASSLEARVLHLLDAPRPSRWWPAGPAAAVATLAALGAGPLHSLIEHAVSFLLHLR
jgi:Zn-dependent protease with chaperone function